MKPSVTLFLQGEWSGGENGLEIRKDNVIEVGKKGLRQGLDPTPGPHRLLRFQSLMGEQDEGSGEATTRSVHGGQGVPCKEKRMQK